MQLLKVGHQSLHPSPLFHLISWTLTTTTLELDMFLSERVTERQPTRAIVKTPTRKYHHS